MLLLGTALITCGGRAASAGAAMPKGVVLVTKAVAATMEEGGKKTDLLTDNRVPEGATVRTGVGGSLILIFSNGITVTLHADSTLVLEEYRQEPFAGALKVEDLRKEPSLSRTRIRLLRGELVGRSPQLRDGSSFGLMAKGNPDKVAEVPSGVFRAVVERQ